MDGVIAPPIRASDRQPVAMRTCRIAIDVAQELFAQHLFRSARRRRVRRSAARESAGMPRRAARSCVAMTTPRFFVSRRRTRVRINVARCLRSSEEDGSSSRSRCGCCASARARITICLSPPERLTKERAARCAAPQRPAIPWRSRDRAAIQGESAAHAACGRSKPYPSQKKERRSRWLAACRQFAGLRKRGCQLSNGTPPS